MSDHLANGHQPIRDISYLPEQTHSAGLQDPVRPDDYKSYTRLTHILGLSDEAAVKAWKDSASFKPIFDKLLHDWLEPQLQNADTLAAAHKRGLSLEAAVEYICDEELRGRGRYIWLGDIDISDYDEFDHYALCLTLLRSWNSRSITGVFWHRTLSEEGKDQRLWQAILRGICDAAEAQRNIVEQTEAAELAGRIGLIQLVGDGCAE